MIGLLKNAVINLPIRLKGNSKRTSGNSLSSGAEGSNKDLGAVSQNVTSQGKITSLKQAMTRTTRWDVSRVLLPQRQKLYKWTKHKHELESQLIAEKDNVGFFLIGRASRVSCVAISESHIRGPRCYSAWRRSTDTYWFVSNVWLAEVSRFPRHYWEGKFQFNSCSWCFFFQLRS